MPTEPAAQQCLITPVHRPDIVATLQAQLGSSLAVCSDITSAPLELEQWLGIRTAQLTTIIGRERALLAPFAHLQKLTLREPEHVSYQLEQAPRVSLSEAASVIGGYHRADVRYQSHLPAGVVTKLYPKVAPSAELQSALAAQVIDLRRSELVSPELIQGVQAALVAGKRAILLLNAQDRLVSVQEDGRPTLKPLPGVATIQRQLARALGLTELPASIQVGTRSILQQPLGEVGFCAVVSLDPLLSAETSADQLHGLADLLCLLHTGAPLLVQARQAEHPMVAALAAGTLDEYTTALGNQMEASLLPPISQQIAALIPAEHSTEAEKLFQQLSPILSGEWNLAGPDPVHYKKADYLAVWLHNPQPQALLPGKIRKQLVALARPWQVWRNPWFLL
jgi:primosomal protein N'